MAELDLTEKHVEFIKKTVREILSDVEIYVYGSRVQGKAKRYSDVDIALKSKSAIPFLRLLDIKTAFENSTFPYNVDVIDLNSIKDDFKNIIFKDLYKL